MKRKINKIENNKKNKKWTYKVADIHIPLTSPDVTDLAKSGQIRLR